MYGASDAALQLLPALARRGDLELAAVYDPLARALRRRLALIEPGAARLLQTSLSDDLEAFARTTEIAIAIDGGLEPALRERVPAWAGVPGLELLSPLAASRRLGLAPSAWREPAAPTGRTAPEPEPSTDAAARLDDAIDAAIGAGRRFALLRCVAEAAPGESDADAGDAGIRDRVLEFLRASGIVRSALVVAVDGSVLALWLQPANASAERRVEQARAAAEAVAEALRDASPRPSLCFGYALHPEDGADRLALLARASAPRIRML